MSTITDPHVNGQNGHAPTLPAARVETMPATAADSLSLSGVRDGLAARGVEIPLPQLSQLIAMPEVAEMLRAGGTGARRALPPETVDVLAAFWPRFKEAKGKMPQAPAMLRSFLDATAGESTQLVPIASTALQLPAAAPAPTPVEVAEAQGRAQGLAMADRALTAREAAEMLHVSPTMLRKSVPAWKRFGKAASGDRWLLSQILSK